jgi:hypothetical protein
MMRQNKQSQFVQKGCSVEQAISDANWDKHSSWDALASKSNTTTWKEGKSTRQKRPKK